jgi:lysophospholipase L1-like esterase
MRKYNFHHNLYQSIFSRSFLKEFFFSVLLLSFTGFFLVLILEAFFRGYYLHQETNTKTVLNLPIYQESDYRSWDHLPNSEIQHGDTFIRIGSHGLRNKEIDTIKTKKRYLLLGDSFAFGMGVNESEAFPQKMGSFFGEKYHNVINAGVIGQTIDDAYMYLKNEGIKLQPDFIIYNFFVGNDVTELRRHEWIKNNKDEVVQVKDTILEVNDMNMLQHIQSQEPSSYFLYWMTQKISLIQQKYFEKPSPDPTLTWPVFLADNNSVQDIQINEYWWRYEEMLKKMQELSVKNNIPFIVSIIPMDVQVSHSYWKKYPGMPFDEESFKMKRPQEYMKLLGKRYNIPVIDPLVSFQQEEEQGNTMYFSDDPHFTPLGHRFMASYIWEFLMNNYL